MRKFILVIAILILTATALVSCGSESDVPEGLAVVEISEEHGFKFYCPEGWTLINSRTDLDKQIWGAKMSSFTNISVTLAKADMPISLGEAPDAASSLAAIKAYYTESLKEFPENMGVKTVSEPALSNFGNAAEAYKCVYTYKYESYDFACMQYFVRNGGDFYIFTYTSYGDTEDEASDYRIYLEKVETALKSFAFTEKSKEGSVYEPIYEKDEEGYNLVSNKDVCGFELYLPDSVKVIVSDGYVTAKISDSASIYLGKATATGVSINKYWDNRKAELERFADKDSLRYEENEVNRINTADSDVKVVLGDLEKNRVASYEFTYSIGGVTYHVYQVMGVDTFNGYVFTYTATEEEFEEHRALVEKIIGKVRF